MWHRLRRVSNTAPGTDGLRYAAWRALDPGALLLTRVFELCQCAVWPAASLPPGSSETVLLHKGGDPTRPGIWRPIALATTVAKLYAGLWSDRLSALAECHDLLSPQQKGFQAFDGVLEHNLSQLLDSAHPDNLSGLMSRQEETLLIVRSYFTSNSLKMNPSKTTLILVGTPQNLKKTSSFRINIAGHILTPSLSVKLLGVTLDRSLLWDEHICSVVKKCYSILVCLYKIRHHLTPEARKLLIQSHVFPHILYCLSVWGGAAACHLSRVQKILYFGARIVTGTRIRDHITPALETLGWPSVRDLVAHRDCIGVFRALSDKQAPLAVRSLFRHRADVSQRVTRATAAGELELPALRLSLSRRVFSYRAASSWNRLPPATMASRSRGEFVRQLSPMSPVS